MQSERPMVLLVALALGWFQTAVTVPTCQRSNGQTVCGFACLAAHGELACARTPRGVCGASTDGVVCWDPPAAVRAHYGDKTPRPGCITRAGHTECGYRCQAHDDDIACAATPDGICRSTARGVTCWDPPVSAYCADDRALPRPRCVVVGDDVACGYDCLARNGEMACARTPGGRCQATASGIVCFDAELPPMCGDVPCAPETGERSWCTIP